MKVFMTQALEAEGLAILEQVAETMLLRASWVGDRSDWWKAYE